MNTDKRPAMSLRQDVLLERDGGLKQALWGTLLFAVIAIVGLFIVKWSPYWHKAHVAAAVHGIGASIVSGKGVHPEAVGLHAGWSYTLAYFKSVWQAVVLALLMGASVQAFLPRAWLVKALGRPTHSSTAIATASSVATMMCTCCTAPVVVGLRRAHAAAGSALAFLLGNPVLNPATLVFIGFVLGWKYAGLRLGLGMVLVFAVAAIANALSKDEGVPVSVPATAIETRGAGSNMFAAWLRELWIELYTIIPGYVAIVFIVGALQAWLFPPGLELHASGIGAVAAISALGTLFVIPTAGEVPIIQTLQHAGMGQGPAAALLMTLPAISLPSIFIVRKVFSARVLAWAALCVFFSGIVAGLIVML